MTKTSLFIQDSDDCSISGEQNKSENDDVSPRLTDFEQFRFLDKGIQGDVYEARRKSDGIIYAIKIVRQNASAPETDFIYNLDHENIVKCSSYWCQDVDEETLDLLDNFQDYEWHSINCTQMELCLGRNLVAWIRKSKSYKSVAHAKSIFFQIALGIEYIHKQGIMHRDLKPANIFLSKKYDKSDIATNIIVKIGDFGSAKRISAPCEDAEVNPATPERTPMGYRCPQQVQGKPYKEKTDIYSAGILFYELLFSSVAPLPSKNAETVKCGIFPEEFVENFPEEAELIRSMLLNDDSARISAGDVVKRLREIWDFDT